jgi:hypothetical protein
MRWGMPPPPRTGGPPVTNIRNTSSPHWRGWLKPENRCLVPFNSFAEYAPEPNPETKKKDVVWFALDDDRPLTSFAGIWTEFKGDRATGGDEVSVLPEAAEGRVPPDTLVAGMYHTHGDYSELSADGNIVATHDPSRDEFFSDRFTMTDFEKQIDLARHARLPANEVPERYRRRFIADYGAPPVRDLTFYLAGPGRIFRKHDPNATANALTAARRARTGELIPGGGTDVPLQQSS